VTGERFGPYVLEGLIGRGGMGEVHRAVDTRKDRVVAVKRLPAELAAGEGFQARFRRESQIAARLADVHVIPIHDYGEIDGRLFIDMPLIDGVDLATLVEHHPEGLGVERAVEIVAQVAGALDTAHNDGLVHRDVKPSNVLVRDDHGADFAYLIDFGIARGVGDGKITTAGAIVGTLAYLAPERFDGPGDRRGDVYALACVLFEALTGRAPFAGHDLASYFNFHFHTPPPRPSQVRAGLPAALDDVIARGMAKDLAQRYQRAGELAAAARAALGSGRGAPATRIGAAMPAWPGPGGGDSATTETTNVSNTAPPLHHPTVIPPPWTIPLRLVHRRRMLGWVVGAVAALAALLVAMLGTAGDETVTVAVGASPRGVVVSPDGTRAYVTNRGSGTVSVIDTARPTAPPTTISGGDADDLAVSPDGTRIYVLNSVSGTVSVFDSAQLAAPPTTIDVRGFPTGVAVSPEGTRVYVVLDGSPGTVSIIDAKLG
jgi:serine/threonine protein kinase, bacterial